MEFIPEPLSFNRSSGGTGFREKPKDYFLPRKIAERNLIPILIRECKTWCFTANF
jgi:hypothetical protein